MWLGADLARQNPAVERRGGATVEKNASRHSPRRRRASPLILLRNRFLRQNQSPSAYRFLRFPARNGLMCGSKGATIWIQQPLINGD